MVAAARLRGELATAAGHHAAAAAAFETAWRRAQGLRVPLALGQLEISDARRLRAARQRLITLAPGLTCRSATGSWPLLARPWDRKRHPPWPV